MTLTRRLFARALTTAMLLGACPAWGAIGDDWANLAAYRQADVALTVGDADPNRIVFMGDSITEFWTRNAPAFFADGHRINRGISGQTTGQMLLRFQQDVIALHPSTVVILAGTNDVAGNNGPASDEEIEANLLSMIELAQHHHIRVVLLTLVPAAHYPWADKVQPVPRIAALNTWIRAEAAREHLGLADVFPAMATPEGALLGDLGDDGVHPNPAGYAVIAKVLEPVLMGGQR